MSEQIKISDIKIYHENALKKFGIPNWILQQDCPQCHQKIDFISIRAIGLKTNAQHMGNIFVEICCSNCRYGYELHLENFCLNIDDFIMMLKNKDEGIKMIPDYLIPIEQNNLLTRTIKEQYHGNTKA